MEPLLLAVQVIVGTHLFIIVHVVVIVITQQFIYWQVAQQLLLLVLVIVVVPLLWFQVVGPRVQLVVLRVQVAYVSVKGMAISAAE